MFHLLLLFVWRPICTVQRRTKLRVSAGADGRSLLITHMKSHQITPQLADSFTDKSYWCLTLWLEIFWPRQGFFFSFYKLKKHERAVNRGLGHQVESASILSYEKLNIWAEVCQQAHNVISLNTQTLTALVGTLLTMQYFLSQTAVLKLQSLSVHPDYLMLPYG